MPQDGRIELNVNNHRRDRDALRIRLSRQQLLQVHRRVPKMRRDRRSRRRIRSGFSRQPRRANGAGPESLGEPSAASQSCLHLVNPGLRRENRAAAQVKPEDLSGLGKIGPKAPGKEEEKK